MHKCSTTERLSLRIKWVGLEFRVTDLGFGGQCRESTCYITGVMKLTMELFGITSRLWVLPPLRNSWITIIIWLYIALHRTPNVDSYWEGAVPKVDFLSKRDSEMKLSNGLGFRV